MLRNKYTVISDLSGGHYEELLAVAETCCAHFLFVVREDLGLADEARFLLDACRPHVEKVTRAQAWPGTELLEGYACVYLLSFGKETRRLISRAASSLFDWTQPQLPEDLCLLRGSGEPWLVSIAHEKDVYLELTKQEAANLQQRLPWIRFIE